MILRILDIFLHLDIYLKTVVSQFQALTYLLLFVVIFLETGIVIMPFLPGDSLLFTAGALAASGSFNIYFLSILIFIAAVAGDALNYHIGKVAGPKIFKKDSSLFFNKKYLERASEFYEKHGKKAIILARFVPIIRTFAPFVAGIGRMSYGTFFIYNVVGAALWCALFIGGGFLFGNIPWVSQNLGFLIVAIIVVFMLPVVKEIVMVLIRKKKVEEKPTEIRLTSQ